MTFVPSVDSIPETARICRITHTLLAAGEEVVLHDRSKGSPAERVIGEDAIRSHLSNLNREVGSAPVSANSAIAAYLMPLPSHDVHVLPAMIVSPQ